MSCHVAGSGCFGLPFLFNFQASLVAGSGCFGLPFLFLLLRFFLLFLALLLVCTLPMLLLTVLGAVASLLTATARSELLLQVPRTSTS